jgi:predicted glycogen debranching enzyme
MPSPAPIIFGPQLCGDLSAAATREWVVPDGCGGYAMGTVAGLRTRRYHGLLVVSGARASDRHVGLAALDPVLTLPSGATVRLGCHQWASGVVSPDGYRFLERFELVDGLPRWRWRVGDVVLERELAMGHRQRALGVVHRLLAGGPVRLTLDALCTWRDAHGERFASGGPLPTEPAADGFVVEGAYRVAGAGFAPAGGWYLGAHLREEADRGLAAHEDLWHAGSFGAELAVGQALEVSAWAGELGTPPPPAREVVAAARARARAVVAAAHPADEVDAALALAADAFVVRPPEARAPDVVAGYPWFGAWSRDTMISYEGLFLRPGRAEEGRELLRGYAATVSEGMLANTADTGSVEYNTVDGTLWFAHAVGRHVAVAGDDDLAAELVPVLDGIVAAHLAGTRYGIRVDPADGLLTQGRPGYALTWMDAVINGVAVTPRHGKPVEVNALWINALATLAALKDRVAGGRGGQARPGSGQAQPGSGAAGADAQALREQAARATASFRRRFPAPSGWLYDVIDSPDGAPDDPALRPNQALAYALPFAPLRGEAPPAALGSALLTPLGPRSLAADEPGYRSLHRGTPADRDHAYHQGTVWPWLIGPYADARQAAGLPVDDLFDGLTAHLAEGGLGSVSETADGAAPHQLSGCPFQAWSVAEFYRARRAG